MIVGAAAAAGCCVVDGAAVTVTVHANNYYGMTAY